MDHGRRVLLHAAARPVLRVLTAVAPLAVTLALPGLGTPETSAAQKLGGLLLCGGLLAVVLLLRRRWPVASALVCSGVSTAAMLLLGAPTALVLAVFVALGSLAVHRPLRIAVVLWAVSSVLQLAGELATGGWDERVLAPLALMAASTAVGVAVRQQRLALDSARARAEAAERTREQEAARRVADERLRIARELHDVVAHHVAVMGVQAGVAGHLMESDPVQSRAALAQVRASGRTAVAELGALVGLLRSHEEDDAPGAPAPGLAQLPRLLETMRRSGLEVRTSRLHTSGGLADPHGLDEMTDITAYRIVQESLTNALRHGTGGVDLVVERVTGGVDIRVSNCLLSQRPHQAAVGVGGGGHGLVGMRERAALVGADVRAGPTADGRFEVRAHLPRRAS